MCEHLHEKIIPRNSLNSPLIYILFSIYLILNIPRWSFLVVTTTISILVWYKGKDFVILLF